MFQSTHLRSVALTVFVASLLVPAAARSAPRDLPCEVGPMFTSSGTLGANLPQWVLSATDAEKTDGSWVGTKLWSLYSHPSWMYGLNGADGYSHNYRWSAGINFTAFEFDEFNGDAIPDIRTEVLTLEAGMQFHRKGKRASRVGVRVPYIEYRDHDPVAPSSESGLFDVEIFGDFPLPWTKETKAYLQGMVIETRLTLPTGDEEEFLGREDATFGLRPRWFLRWTPHEKIEGTVALAKGTGVRLTQVHFSAGLGHVWDFGVSDNSYWSPVLGVQLAWSDLVFLDLEVQGELHESGLDQYDWLTDVSFRLLPEGKQYQVFLSVGAIVALNDEGLRDGFAPTVGVTVAFGTGKRKSGP